MKIIRNCKDCGFFRYTNPTNYHFKGAAICSYRSKKLHGPYETPTWCHLEDAVLTNAMHSDGEGGGVKSMGDILRNAIHEDKV